MKIPCISCQSLFRLDSDLVKSTGSLVRCSKCEYIFMVYPPTFNDEPTVKDTNIDQSILFDLFEVEQTNKAKGILDKTSETINRRKVDEMASVEDFNEEEAPEIEDIDPAELTDWDYIPDAEDLTEHEKQFYNSTQDLDINEG